MLAQYTKFQSSVFMIGMKLNLTIIHATIIQIISTIVIFTIAILITDNRFYKKKQNMIVLLFLQ